MSRTHLWFGPNGTRKTRAAIQSALDGEKVSLFELEPNGFRRAAGIDLEQYEKAENFRLHSYRVPATALEQLGSLHIMEGKNGPSLAIDQLTYELHGWLPLLSRLHSEYMKDCQDGYRPVVDTGTRLWLIERNAWEEQLQAMTQAQIDKAGQSKYTTANYRYLSLLEYADQFNLDTIVIAHEDTVYNSNPPIPKPDAMKETENLVDVVLRFRMAGDHAVANIWKGAEVGRLKGLDVPDPTLARVNQALDGGAIMLAAGEPLTDIEAIMDAPRYLRCQEAIRKAGLAMPADYAAVVATGEALA